MGSSTLVELLPSDPVVKSPKIHPSSPQEEENIRGMDCEAFVHGMLGDSPFTLELSVWGSKPCILTLRNHSKRDLVTYIEKHTTTRESILAQATEPGAAIHASNVMHNDVSL